MNNVFTCPHMFTWAEKKEYFLVKWAYHQKIYMDTWCNQKKGGWNNSTHSKSRPSFHQTTGMHLLLTTKAEILTLRKIFCEHRKGAHFFLNIFLGSRFIKIIYIIFWSINKHIIYSLCVPQYILRWKVGSFKKKIQAKKKFGGGRPSRKQKYYLFTNTRKKYISRQILTSLSHSER